MLIIQATVFIWCSIMENRTRRTFQNYNLDITNVQRSSVVLCIILHNCTVALSLSHFNSSW